MRPFYLCLFLFTLPAYAASIEKSAQSIPPRNASTKPTPCPRYDLHAAVRLRNTTCWKIALDHMDINDRDRHGDTPLHNAVQLQNGLAVRFLLKNGADLYLRDFRGQTARELAESMGSTALGDFLAETERETERFVQAVDSNDISGASSSLHRGASLGARDIRLDTALHKAAQSGLTDMARLLIHYGANVNARNYLSETPLHTAALRDQKELIELFLDSGADVNAMDERRNTPLDLVLGRGDPEIVAILRKKKARSGMAASVSDPAVSRDGSGIAPPPSVQ